MNNEEKRQALRTRLEPEIKVTQSGYIAGAELYVTRARLGPIEENVSCPIPMCKHCRSVTIEHVLFSVFKRECCAVTLCTTTCPSPEDIAGRVARISIKIPGLNTFNHTVGF
jgi:hypothetical protein